MGNYRATNIVHVQASDVSTQLYGWIVSETAARLARRRARVIHCRASCPKLTDALQRIGFSKHAVAPAS